MTRVRIRTACHLLALACLCTASGAGAARQGALGASSSGSIVIRASVAHRAAVSGPSDIALSGMRASRAICLADNSLAGAYRVTAIGGGRDGAFELSDGARTLAYAVEWDREAGCGQGRAARVTIDPARLNDAAQATFTGTLTLLVAPE